MGLRRRTPPPDGLGWAQRLMFSFMGPPQLGDLNAPVAPPPSRPPDLCSQCREPIDEHEVVRDPGLTWLRCADGRQRGT